MRLPWGAWGFTGGGKFLGFAGGWVGGGFWWGWGVGVLRGGTRGGMEAWRRGGMEAGRNGRINTSDASKPPPTHNQPPTDPGGDFEGAFLS
jgi:hypothetical protein